MSLVQNPLPMSNEHTQQQIRTNRTQNNSTPFFSPANRQPVQRQSETADYDHAELVELSEVSSTETVQRQVADGQTGGSNAATSEQTTTNTQTPASTEQLRDAVARGLTLSLYVSEASPFDNNERTFATAGREFAAEHAAIMVQGGQVIFGSNAAQPVAHISEIVSYCRTVTTHLTNVLQTETPVRIQTLALFTHGLNDYLNFGGGNAIANDQETSERVNRQARSNRRAAPDSEEAAYQERSTQVEKVETAQGFANAVDPYLSDTGRLIMYACLTAGTYDGHDSDIVSAGRTARRQQRRGEAVENAPNPREVRTSTRQIEQDHETGGEGSFADTLRDELNREEGQNREIWGHRTAGHTTRNPTWRVFDGPQGEGERASDDLYSTEHNFRAERGRRAICTQAVQRLNSVYHQNVTDNEAFKTWIAREMPFVPANFRPFVTAWQGNTPTLREGLVDWFCTRYMGQRGDFSSY